MKICFWTINIKIELDITHSLEILECFVFFLNFMLSRIQILRAQLALLQLALTTDDLTPPESAAVSAAVGIE
jgi:hypothetical protein